MDKINFRPENSAIQGKKVNISNQKKKEQDQGEVQLKDVVTLGRYQANPKERPRIPHGSIKRDENHISMPEKDVTFLFYMDGQYGDLEHATASSFLGLEQAGSNENVNLIAQLGRAAQREAHPTGGFDRIDNDWSGVRRYYITKSPKPHKEEVDLDKWLKINDQIPDNPLIHFTLGDVYYKKGNFPMAEMEYGLAKECGYEKFLDNPFHPDVARWSDEFDKKLQPLRDKEANNNIFASPVTEFKGNVNMMHPQSLQDFVAYGMKKFPAKHYILVLMGHGGAWTGALKMSPSEIGMAVQAGVYEANRTNARSDTLDAIIFNSCYMGNLESIDQLRDAADVTVASQMSARTNVFYHWPQVIDKVQNILRDGKEFKPRKLARDFVKFYEDVGETNSTRQPMLRRSKESYLTLVALDNTKIRTLSDKWKKFIDDWKSMNVEDHLIFRNVKKSKNYPSFAYSPEMMFDYGTLRDIGSIAINVMNDPDIPQKLKIDCKEIRQALRDAVIAEQHTGYNMEGSSGLTVWAPTNAADISLMNKAYRDRVPTFAHETGWADKLEESIKNVDGHTLHSFAQTIQMLGNLTKMMEVPGLSEKERQNLEKKAQILEQEAFQLKKELDLSIKRDRGSIRNIVKSMEKENDYKKRVAGLNIPLPQSECDREKLKDEVVKRMVEESDKATGMATAEPGPVLPPGELLDR